MHLLKFHIPARPGTAYFTLTKKCTNCKGRRIYANYPILSLNEPVLGLRKYLYTKYMLQYKE